MDLNSSHKYGTLEGEMLYEPIVILSVELASAGFYTNSSRNDELRAKLLQMGLSFVGAKLHNNGEEKFSFIVVTPHFLDLLHLARNFGQSSILVSDLTRNTREVFTDGRKSLPLGKLCSASKNSLSVPKLYLSFQEDGKEHFYTTKGEENDGPGHSTGN